MAAQAVTTIYVLELKHGKYYVGKSADPQKRFDEHRAGHGSAWTRLHPPIRIERLMKGASAFDEDRYVKEYMARHGVENVRGGSYSAVELDEVQRHAIQQELRGASDACMRCGRRGHFVGSCYARTDVHGHSLDDSSDDSDDSSDSSDSEDSEDSDEDEDEVTCFRCGRVGHYANTCYVKK